MSKVMVVATIAVLMIACGSSSSPTSPAVLQVAGTWSGTTTSSLNGTNGVVFTLTQNGTTIGGTYATKAGDSQNTDAGSINGTLSGSSVSLSLAPGNPSNCPWQVTGTINGNTMTGTFATRSCTVSMGGTFSATKQ